MANLNQMEGSDGRLSSPKGSDAPQSAAVGGGGGTVATANRTGTTEESTSTGAAGGEAEKGDRESSRALSDRAEDGDSAVDAETEEEEEERYTEIVKQHTGSEDVGEEEDDADGAFSSSPEREDPVRRRRSEEARRSVAYAGALVGESVVDAPPCPSPPPSESASRANYSQKELKAIMSKMEGMNRQVAEAAEKRGVASRAEKYAAGYRSGGAAQGNRMDRTGGESGDYDNEEDDDYEEVGYDDYEEGPGLIGAGIGAARNWWARRRERRRQLELARQVEEQRRKLQLEARMRAKAKMTRGADHSWVRDTGSSALEAKLQAMTGGSRVDRKVAGEAWTGGGGVIAGICGVEEEEEGYGSGGSNSMDTDDSCGSEGGLGPGTKKGMRISHAKRTMSGNGMAVAVEFPDEEDEDGRVQVVVVPEKPMGKDGDEVSPFLLSEAQMRQIAQRVLPPALMLCRWKRLYSLARDGDSFDTFLRLVADTGRSLLVIRTTRGEVFGAYSDSPYEAKHHGAASASFYGSAQACLWRILPSSGEVRAYKWSGMNRYIQLVDTRSKMIAFGGGGNAGEFGLCVEDDFRRGSTGPCGTFGNEPLCDHADGGSFEVVDVECWGFLSGFG